MSDPEAAELLEKLLTDNEVLDKSEKVGDSVYRLRWGSANIITAIVRESIVVLAKLFDAMPAKDADKFCRRLLEINGELGGTASFAVQRDGAVVLQVGRGIRGLDSEEFGIMLGTIGKFADDYDDVLAREFYN